ncbi:MAG: signal peptidase I [Eubacteriaceae bacterium]
MEKKSSKKNKMIKILGNILFYGLIICILTSAFLFMTSNSPDKSYFGYRIYEVKTQSMSTSGDKVYEQKGFKAGDAVIVKQVDLGEIKRDDIITFSVDDTGESYLTHRVKEVVSTEDGKIQFVTRGDTNNADDPIVNSNRVIGKVIFSLPGVGGILGILRQNILMVGIFVVAFIGFVSVLKGYFGKEEK